MYAYFFSFSVFLFHTIYASEYSVLERFKYARKGAINLQKRRDCKGRLGIVGKVVKFVEFCNRFVDCLNLK